jgi:hypothetical protein
MSIHAHRTRARRTPMILGAAGAAVALTLAAAPPAVAQLTAPGTTKPDVGAPDVNTGFPSYYADADGTKVKLCVDSPNCLGGDPRPNPLAAASVATGNLPDEAFYAVARAEATLTLGGRIRWRAVLEGAFLNEDVVDGEQMTFTRVQVVGSKIARQYIGTTLTFKTPYGELKGLVKSDGTLDRARKESAPGLAPGFTAPALEKTTGYGPKFLKWDSGAPAGFLGDPLRLHTVTGGTTGNSFYVLDAGGKRVSDIVNEFEVAGQVVTP